MAEKNRDLASLFATALELDAHGRAELERSCDSETARELRELLGLHREASGFLSRAPFQVSMAPATSPDGGRTQVGQPEEPSVFQSLGVRSGLALTRVSLPEATPTGSADEETSHTAGKTRRYEIESEIARGGMGAILRGRDVDLGRPVAIKRLLDVHRDNPNMIQRFVEEAQIGGQLQHPGITPIYGLGHLDEVPFFTMKLVKGQTLAAMLAQRPSADSGRGRFLGIFEQVCQAIAYAHSRGVIHRDLKPANIMVGAFGEVQVMDWGLAKVLQSGGVADEKKARETHHDKSIIKTIRSVDASGSGSPGSAGSDTQMGSVMGTPAYMPPEQALGEVDRLDERCDVFGLGAILCEILTGKPPYVAKDSIDVFRQASRGKLDDCFERLEKVGGEELVVLVKDCLQLEPIDRPRNAGVVGERVAAYLVSVETRLRQAEVQRAADAARVVEERRRGKTTLAFAASTLLMLAVGVGGWWWTNDVKTRRQLEATGQFNSLLTEARLQRGRADHSEVPEDRVAGLENALAVARQAVELGSRNGIEKGLHDSATTLVTQLKDEANSAKEQAGIASQNAAWKQELELIRVGHADARRLQLSDNQLAFDVDETNRQYRRVFAEMGINLQTMTPAEVATVVRKSPIRESLIMAMDHWVSSLPKSSEMASLMRLRLAEDWTGARRIAEKTLTRDADSLTWLAAAPFFALADGGDRYPDFCSRILERFAEPHNYFEIGRTCKACLLIPDAVEVDDLPAARLAEELDQQRVMVRFLGYAGAVRALIEYRRGDFPTAMSVVEQTESSLHDDYDTAWYLPIRALVEHALGRPEAAATLNRSADLIAQLREQGNQKRRESNVPLKRTYREDLDLLFAEVLQREAEVRINGTSKTGFATFAGGQGTLSGESIKQKLLGTLDACDTNSWRRSVREAILDREHERLGELATNSEVNRQSAGMLVWLGTALRDEGKLDLSVETLRMAQRKFPGDFWLNFELGQSLSAIERYDESLGFARAAYAIRPQSVAACWATVSLLTQIGETEQAAQLFSRIVDDPDADAEQLRWFARKLRFSKNPANLQSAALAGRRATELDPNNSEAFVELATIRFLQGSVQKNTDQTAAAEAASRQAIALNPTHSMSHVLLALALTQQQKFPAAEAACRKAIEMDPGLLPATKLLGELLRAQGRDDEAKLIFESVAENAGDYYSPDKAGKLLFQMGYFSNSIPHLERAIEIDDDDATSFSLLGRALLKTGKVRRAESLFRKAIERNPDDAFSHNSLAVILRITKPDEAIAAAKRAIELKPGMAEAYCNLGIALVSKGEAAQGVPALRESIRRGYDNAFAYSMLGSALGLQGKLPEAEREYRKAIELDKENAAYHAALGELLGFAGNRDEALAEFQLAMDLNPGKAFAAYYGAAYVRATLPVDGEYVELEEAEELARRSATQFQGFFSGFSARVLGVVLYRRGKWEESINELERSLLLEKALPKGARNEMETMLFLAMAHWQLGDKEKANEWFNKAIQWQDNNDTSPLQQRFLPEASELLQVGKGQQ